MQSSTGFGSMLHSLLNQRKVTPADLAKAIHTDASLVRKWLAGSRVPALRTDYYDRICDYLHLDNHEKQVLKDSQIYSLNPRSALKAAEARAQQSELLLSLLFKSSQDAILLVSPPDGAILSANPAAFSLLQVNADNFSSIGSAISVCPENLPFSDYLLLLIKQKKSNACSKLLINNKIFPVDINLQFCDPVGQAEFVLCLMHEITEPGLLEKISVFSQNRALLAEQKFDAIMSSISDGFFLLDNNWVVTFANRALLSNPVAADFVGKNIIEDFPRVEEFHESFLNVKKTKESERRTAYIPFAKVWIELNIHPLSDDGMAVYVRQVTGPSQGSANAL